MRDIHHLHTFLHRSCGTGVLIQQFFYSSCYTGAVIQGRDTGVHFWVTYSCLNSFTKLLLQVRLPSSGGRGSRDILRRSHRSRGSNAQTCGEMRSLFQRTICRDRACQMHKRVVKCELSVAWGPSKTDVKIRFCRVTKVRCGPGFLCKSFCV